MLHRVSEPPSPVIDGTRQNSGERADAFMEQQAAARRGREERNAVAPFDAESLSITARGGERKGRELQERADGVRRADGNVEAYEPGKGEGDNCWVTAYQQLMGSCKEVLRNEAWKAQLALRLTNCFLASSGRAPVDCRSSSSSKKRGSSLQVYMKGRAEGSEKQEQGVDEEECIKSMSDHEHSVFLAFFIDAPNMCHFLQSELFKNEVETSVNSLKRTAHWLEGQLGDLSGSAEDMQATAQASLHLQQRIAEEQGAVQQQVAALSESAHHAQAVLESLTGQQAAMAAEITQGVSHLEDQVLAVDAVLQQSLQQQQAAAAEQAAAAQQMEVIRQQQAAALDQHRRVLQELSEMASAEQHSTGKWQAEMAQLQEELLAGQRQAAGEMKRIAVEQTEVAERQNEVMGELAARTVAYHMSSQRWQARMSEEQQVLLAVQQQVAGQLSAVAVEAERQHKVLATWNERMEATQEQLLGNAERMLAVQGTCLAAPQCMSLDEEDRECEGQGEVDKDDRLPELQPDRHVATGEGGEGWEGGLGGQGEGRQQQRGSGRGSEGEVERGERVRRGAVTRAMARQVVERSLARQRARMQAAASAARRSHENGEQEARAATMIPISDFDQHARRFLDPDQTPLQRLQLATEVRDSIEIAHTAEYGNFLRAYFQVFVAVLRQLTAPQVQLLAHCALRSALCALRPTFCISALWGLCTALFARRCFRAAPFSSRLRAWRRAPTPYSPSSLPVSPSPPSPRLFPPSHAQFVDNLEHKFRNVVLEVLNRLPHSEALQPYVPELLRVALTVLATDNEDNAMVALRIIFDLHKNFRPKLEHDVQPFLDFVCKIYQSFPATVSFFFDEGGGGEQMRRAAGMGDGAAGGAAAGAGAGAGGLGGGPGGVGGGGAGVAVPSQLNPSTRSFRVVTECPLIVMFLFQVYPRYAGHSISVLLPLMMQCIAIVGPSPHHHVPPRLKAAYADLKAAQIKTVSFLTYLLRGYADIIRPHEANIAKSIVNLLLTCPDVVATRKVRSPGLTLSRHAPFLPPCLPSCLPAHPPARPLVCLPTAAHYLTTPPPYCPPHACVESVRLFPTSPLHADALSSLPQPLLSPIPHSAPLSSPFPLLSPPAVLTPCRAHTQELLVATRHVLATDFKRGFFPQLDTLLDERCCSTLLSPMLSLPLCSLLLCAALR
ncbi:unnamed protein product [Closterium sp. NIES-54]